MSGGSYDYAYVKVNDMACNLRLSSPLRRAFRQHLLDTADAMKSVEWADSCDISQDDADAAIKKAMGERWMQATLAEAVFAAHKMAVELNSLIEEAKKGGGA